MPVVTPSRASIETVNGVWKGDSFLAAIRSRPSSSQRSGVSDRQISPRPWVAMKLIASGVTNSAAIVRSPSFSRSSSSHDHDHAAGADVGDRVFDRRERRGGHRVTSFSTYLANTSTSRFTGVPGAAAPRFVRSRVSGMRETVKSESLIAATVSETPSTAIEPLATT